MFVSAWDFVRDGRIHSRMAVVRGVEGGLSMARSAQQGLLTVSDYLGRILTEGLSSQAAEVLLSATIPMGPGSTFYSRTGDWVAWFSVVLAIALLGSAMLFGAKSCIVN